MTDSNFMQQSRRAAELMAATSTGESLARMLLTDRALLRKLLDDHQHYAWMEPMGDGALSDSFEMKTSHGYPYSAPRGSVVSIDGLWDLQVGAA